MIDGLIDSRPKPRPRSTILRGVRVFAIKEQDDRSQHQENAKKQVRMNVHRDEVKQDVRPSKEAEYVQGPTDGIDRDVLPFLKAGRAIDQAYRNNEGWKIPMAIHVGP